MFSARTRWNLQPNRLAALLDAKKRSGRAILDLTESNPTSAGFETPLDVLEMLVDPRASRYEPAARGLEEARAAVSADYARRGVHVPPEDVFLAASTSEAYAFLFKLLGDPGDAVLVPRPSYPLLEYLGGLESVRVDGYPLAYDGEWHLDLRALEAAVDARTRAVVVVHPNNPTGHFLKQAEAEALAGLCAERGLAIVSDEVFADYALRPDSRRVTSLAGDGPALTFTLGGLSKSCGLPQLKLAWMTVSGPPALRDEARARLDVVADTYLSVGTPVQVAARRLLARRAELQAPIAARIAVNLDGLRSRLDERSPVTLLAVEGGWYAVLRVPANRSEDDLILDLLDSRDVLVHPGYFFEFAHEAYLIASLLPRPEVFASGVERLLEQLDREG
jgi:aspartate/methionine/tyrosine aminotransferase